MAKKRKTLSKVFPTAKTVDQLWGKYMKSFFLGKKRRRKK